MVETYYDNDWLNLSKELINKNLLTSKELESFKSMFDSPDAENEVLAKEIIRLRIGEAYLENMGFNPDQKKAFVSLISYMTDAKDHDAAVLKGYAGTGKTYLISGVVDFMQKAYPNRKIAVTAPTNKAVKVLAKGTNFYEQGVFKTKHRDRSKIDYGTIHSILGVKEVIDDNGKRSFIIDEKKCKISDYRYLIVDESSMLDDEMYNLLMNNKGNMGIIFMGDPAQIPPVNQEQSLPFSNKNPHKLVRLQLNQIMRQKKDNPIVDYSLQIRQNLTAKNPISLIESKVSNSGKVVAFNSKTDRKKLRPLLNKFYNSKRYQSDVNYIKTIAWRNKSVKYLNNVIREEIHGSDIKERFVADDILIANSALFTLNDWGTLSLMANTSTEFKVSAVDITTQTNHTTNKGLAFNSKIYSIDCNEVQTNDWYMLDVLHEDSVADYKKFVKKLYDYAKVVKKSDAWIEYYDALKWFHDVDYAYAITAHKSQGSTYNNVIFIEEDLDHNHKTVERNRIKYTAYTRASEDLYLLTNNSKND